jgi:hypothetical protein
LNKANIRITRRPPPASSSEKRLPKNMSQVGANTSQSSEGPYSKKGRKPRFWPFRRQKHGHPDQNSGTGTVQEATDKNGQKVPVETPPNETEPPEEQQPVIPVCDTPPVGLEVGGNSETLVTTDVAPDEFKQPKEPQPATQESKASAIGPEVTGNSEAEVANDVAPNESGHPKEPDPAAAEASADHQDKPPLSRRRQKAQDKFKKAAEKLEATRSKVVAKLDIPEKQELQNFAHIDDVYKVAEAMDSVIDKIDDIRSSKATDPTRLQRAKKKGKSWFKVAIPLLKTGINIGKVPAVRILANRL